MATHVCPEVPVFYQNLYWRRFCIPEIVTCDTNPKDGLIGNCDDNWNNNLCQTDLCWSWPIVRGDKFQLQTRFRDQWNTEETNDGIGTWVKVALYKTNGELVSEDHTDFMSRVLSGNEPRGDYQLYEIDTSLAAFEGVDCFRIQFIVLKPGETETEIVEFACLQDMCFVQDCDAYPLLCPEIKGYDGFGYYYGQPVQYTGDLFTFEPCFRIRGGVFLKGAEQNKIITGRSVSLLNVREVYHFDVQDWVAPYFLKVLMRQILAGRFVTVNGEQFETSDQTITRSNKGNRNLALSFNLYKNGQTNQTNDC